VKRSFKIEKCFFGLAINDARHLAHQLAQSNNTQNPFSEASVKPAKMAPIFSSAASQENST
jgi:hypothetical protein